MNTTIMPQNAVSTVLHEIMLRVPVPHPSTRVRIWVNHPREPDKMIIGLD
jgi:hypothetical protein